MTWDVKNANKMMEGTFARRWQLEMVASTYDSR